MDRTQADRGRRRQHSEKEIADILYTFGEERRSRPIARSTSASPAATDNRPGPAP
jgi:16S rRNA C1402 N4-methylase RsmH